MDTQHDSSRDDFRRVEEVRLLTHRGVIERLADPYLTDHDRWVLGQFARFLDGQAPAPDRRAIGVRSQQPLHSRARRPNL
ncbi:MAG: hypothetical protein R6W93_16410 [Candidatus Limnocylindrales bacterium]